MAGLGDDDDDRRKLYLRTLGQSRVESQQADPHLTPLASDPQPSVIGGGWLEAIHDERARIRTPMIRKGWLERRDRFTRNGDAYVAVDWDAALDFAAEEMRRIRSEHGNGAIFACSYGWASAGRFHHAQSQIKRFMNMIGGYVAARDTYSHACGEVLLPHVTGMTHKVFQDEMTSWPLVAEHCKLLVCFGGISARTAQIMSGGSSFHEVEGWLARARANGVRIVHISPNRSGMAAALGADWIAPRPSTDTALMMDLPQVFLQKGGATRPFLSTIRVGWPELERYLAGAEDGIAKMAEWAGEICGISPEFIRALALDMAASRTMISLAWGIQRADHGEQPLWMGLALACMLGQIGGFGFGYGSTTPVG